MKNFNRAAKIVATIGPSSRSPEMLEKIILAGVNVIRMNFSHGFHEDHSNAFQMVRDLSEKHGITVGILQDLQGPKVRVGRFKDGQVPIVANDSFIITMDDVEGDSNRVSSTYKSLSSDVEAGMMLLLDDGTMALEVQKVSGNDIITKVIVGGILKDSKGINVPAADLSVPALSEKDLADLKFGSELGVDWVALSFVRTRDDMIIARNHMSILGSKAKLMAKIEKPQAVERFSEILAEADGIMVARGDLGVEMRPEQVPPIQKRIIEMCRNAGKPVITATQMLESMMKAPIPTRAEASDVANAIYDGTDAVMLSGESASGNYPLEAVEMMDRIIREAENTEIYSNKNQKLIVETELAQDSIAFASCSIADKLNASAIVTFTSTGGAATRIAKYRPSTVILALTPNKDTRNQLALSWGVIPVLSEDPHNTDDMVRISGDELQKSGIIKSGDRYLITAGVPFGVKGTTNMLRVEKFEDKS